MVELTMDSMPSYCCVGKALTSIIAHVEPVWVAKGWADGSPEPCCAGRPVPIDAEIRPTTLFEGGIEDRTRLLGALDDINRRFGRFTAAPEGFKREWKMRAESRSHSALPHPRRWRQTCRSSRARNG